MPPRPAQVAETTVPQVGLPTSGAHITTVGVKRPDFSTGGQPVSIFVNSFATTVPSSIIHHYDVLFISRHLALRKDSSSEDDHGPHSSSSIRCRTADLTPRCVYDGRKNIFSIRKLPFDTGSQEFDVTLADASSSTSGKGPKVYKIKLTHVAEINPEVLKRFIDGDQSHDNQVLTAITPSLSYPFNVRSFFTNRETKDIGAGLELWRGYFQSIRPAMGRMLINVDISTGTMYKPASVLGSLLSLCLDYFNKRDPNVLAPTRGFPDRERLRLQRFISGIRILTTHAGPGGEVQTPRVVKKLSTAGASSLTFQMREGQTMTVADYFKNTQNKPLQFPEVICAEVGSGALIPLELCTVPPGQLMRKQVPPEKTKDVLDFATKKPHDRLQSIKNGLSVLAYGQSEYVRQFGMTVDHAAGPLKVQARVLKPPMLKYGPGSRQLTITPRDGAWNMVDKKFFKPVSIDRWVVVIYERQGRFNEGAANDMINGLCASCKDVGITLLPTPFIFWENGQGRIADQLKAAGATCAKQKGKGPNLIVVILPEGGNDIYTSVKHFGDITMGVATQCLKSSKCFRAKPQYYANVCLKINVKLGGINTIPDPSSVNMLTDPHNPTIVMGGSSLLGSLNVFGLLTSWRFNAFSRCLSTISFALKCPYRCSQVIHPAPGSDGRPSFTALVANVDSDTAKYIAASRVQTSRQEMIEELESMSHHCLSMYMRYREMAEKKAAGTSAPKRIIFYRDGVSEGQFKQVLEQELPLIKKACASLKINPKITILVVGKRHHVRFFPQSERDADRSGNCRAGTVVDRDIAHPTEFDFYLQAHGGLLGTSRPAHYSVLYDENNFSADALQSLSFALCHVYARSTRSVSIPAPVYYADIVCSRAKNHYDPQGTVDFSDSATQVDDGQAASSLEAFRRGFKPLHASQSTLMYFS
ncbi:argonaute-like protein [Mycena leptocephala]|nr:argonaute-like protein [Mycena leptocephala]